MKKLFVDHSVGVNDESIRLADQNQVQREFVDSDRLGQLCQSKHHQGFAARMGDFPYRDEQWLSDHIQSQDTNLIVICDRIQDTHNFGAILRSCDAMNVAAVIIGQTEQAAVSPQVARSSAGAVNHVDIVATDDLRSTAQFLADARFTITAASEKSSRRSWDCDFSRPIALILGNEANGVAPALLELCDLQTRIPMMGEVGSLNVAVAAGMLLHEIRRQQISDGFAAS